MALLASFSLPSVYIQSDSRMLKILQDIASPLLGSYDKSRSGGKKEVTEEDRVLQDCTEEDMLMEIDTEILIDISEVCFKVGRLKEHRSYDYQDSIMYDNLLNKIKEYRSQGNANKGHRDDWSSKWLDLPICLSLLCQPKSPEPLPSLIEGTSTHL